ncbi:MAG TPA: NAD(P)H-dependent glycerol-3-phosphate dehydrogenase [Gemmataceae bacterium]|jgi:glycerol-3-phosphate dehydrogenase (NAD(P)+)|nr:NAD(P)H-dependent glycerol-3-phosphate dehydrogenase [Gemmataceae bacterium]
MPKRFSILGDGSWGTAIALLLAEHADYEVTLWSARSENARLLQQARENKQFLPDIPIPRSITLTADVSAATDKADLLIAAIPTVYLRETLKRFSPLAGDQPFLSLAKGLEIDTFARPTEIIQDVLGPRRVGALSGPSHAEEVAKGLPTTIVAASEDLDFARWVQSCFTSRRFRVYTNGDLVGVELAGALKNIVGIAAGISDGLGFGDNAKSALLTRAVVEMARFGVALGAEQQTFFGLAGMGDLMTTCISPHGRNRHVGERLAKGEKLAEILASMTMVAEGIFTTRSVHDKAAQMGIDMPITTEVYRVLYENKDPRSAVLDLMTREPKLE